MGRHAGGGDQEKDNETQRMYAFTKTIQLPVTILLVTLASANALAMNNQDLEEITLQRLSGDRTGACFAVALIDKGEVKVKQLRRFGTAYVRRCLFLLL